MPDWAEPVWHLFVVRHPQRERLQQHLRLAGIDTLIHYPVPPHLSKAYEECGWRPGAFPITEGLTASVLSLPIGPASSLWPRLRWCAAVRAFWPGCGRCVKSQQAEP